MESARKTSLHILVTVVVSFARVCVVPSASNGMSRFREWQPIILRRIVDRRGGNYNLDLMTGAQNFPECLNLQPVD